MNDVSLTFWKPIWVKIVSNLLLTPDHWGQYVMPIYDRSLETPLPTTLDDSIGFSSDDLRSDGQRAIYAWYNRQTKNGDIPKRSNFDPMDFPKYLPFLVLVDVEEAPRRYHVRLVGTNVVDARGRDGTGDYFDEVEGAELAVKRAEAIIESRQAQFETNVPMTWSPKDFRFYSTLSLPLSSDGTKVDKIMYCLDFE